MAHEVCGDGVSCPCQLSKGHASRHVHRANGMVMSWKNFGPEAEARRARDRARYAERKRRKAA